MNSIRIKIFGCNLFRYFFLFPLHFIIFVFFWMKAINFRCLYSYRYRLSIWFLCCCSLRWLLHTFDVAMNIYTLSPVYIRKVHIKNACFFLVLQLLSHFFVLSTYLKCAHSSDEFYSVTYIVPHSTLSTMNSLVNTHCRLFSNRVNKVHICGKNWRRE